MRKKSGGKNKTLLKKYFIKKIQNILLYLINRTGFGEVKGIFDRLTL